MRAPQPPDPTVLAGIVAMFVMFMAVLIVMLGLSAAG